MFTLTLVGDTAVAMEQRPALQVAALYVGYPLGSASEWAPCGAAHFLEHVLASGPGRELHPVGIQARWGALTQRDSTGYWTIVSADLLPDLLRAQASRRNAGAVGPLSVERERRVILNEIGQRREKDWAVGLEVLLSTAFGNHGYGRTVTGSAREVEALTCDILAHIHARGYVSPSVVAVISPWSRLRVAEQIQASGLCRTTPAGRAACAPPAYYRAGKACVGSPLSYTFRPAPNRSAPERWALQVLQRIWQNRLAGSAAAGVRIHLASYAAAGSMVMYGSPEQVASDALLALLGRDCAEGETERALRGLRVQQHAVEEDLLRRLLALAECAEIRSWQPLQGITPGMVTADACNELKAYLLTVPSLETAPQQRGRLGSVPWPYVHFPLSPALLPPPLETDVTEPKATLQEAQCRRHGGGALACMQWSLTSRRHFQLTLDCSALVGRDLYGLFKRFSQQPGVRGVRLAGKHMRVAWLPEAPLALALRATKEILRERASVSSALPRPANGGEYLRRHLLHVIDRCWLSSPGTTGTVQPCGAAVIGTLTMAEQAQVEATIGGYSAGGQGAHQRSDYPSIMIGQRNVDLYVYALPGMNERLLGVPLAAKAGTGTASLESALQAEGVIYSLSAGLGFAYGSSFLWFGLFVRNHSSSGYAEALHEWVCETWQNICSGQVAVPAPEQAVSVDEALERLAEQGQLLIAEPTEFQPHAGPLCIRLRRDPQREA